MIVDHDLPGLRHNVQMSPTALPQRLLTPGPTQVPDQVLRALALPLIHHRTGAFRTLFAELRQRLAGVFRTRHPVLVITGSGTTAFEAAQGSLIDPGQTAITCASGKFGERWQDIYDAFGVNQVRVDVDWGHAVRPEQVGAALEAHKDARVVTLVHSETSTATVCDLKAIAAIVARTDALLIVDGITSVGAIPVEMDQWGVDVVVTGSQKALMLPPGLGYVALGERARHRLARSSGCPQYHLDLRRWLAAADQDNTPFTPPISLIRGQHAALGMIEGEGLENVWARTARHAVATRAALEAMQLKPISAAPADSLTGAYYPATPAGPVDDARFRSALQEKHGIHIAGGQTGRNGNFAGRIFRISHMGHVSADDTLAALEAIETELGVAGVTVDRGAAVRAAKRVMVE